MPTNDFPATVEVTAQAHPHRSRVAGAAALLALAIGYQLLVHWLLAGGRYPLATVFVGLLPFALLLVVLARSAGSRVGAALLPVALGALAWYWRVPLQAGFGWIYLAEHVATQLALGFMFARTLQSGRLALITQFALRVHGGVLTPEQRRYTRQATLAWALFFGLDAGVSLALYAWAPLSVWSAFANLLTLPLVLAMFIGEYLVRRLVLPQQSHVSLAAGARAFWHNRDVADPGTASH